MILSRRITVLTFMLVGGLGVTTSAQFWRAVPKNVTVVPAAMDDPAAWGLASDTVVTVSAFDAALVEGTTGPPSNSPSMSCASPQCVWVVSLQVPNGASIRSLELSACDGDPAKAIGVVLFTASRVPNDSDDIISFSTAGLGPAPGCTVVGSPLPIPVTVANNNFVYLVRVLADSGTNLEWNQVRIRYRLQVSPAPATATFTDVPVGHPQRQFIEALVGAGITGGCGGGNYCPDAPVTRGQMAVFLAAALGLHWPF
jgi:hypothetical protein